MKRILKRPVSIDSLIEFDSKIIKDLDWILKRFGKNSDTYKIKLKELEKIILSLLKRAGFSKDEAVNQLKIWKNDPKMKDKHDKQYNLTYGKYLENVITYFLETYGIRVGFPNGSKIGNISSKGSKMKWFDLFLSAEGLSAGADVKNATLWGNIPCNLNPFRKWVYNTGMTAEKIEDIKKWSKTAKKRGLLILCVPGLATNDVIDQIFVVDVGKLLDKDGKLVYDDVRIAHHPEASNWNNPGLILMDVTPDGETVFAFRDYLKKYGLSELVDVI